MLSFETALRVLHSSKLQLMEIAYGEEYQGIDSAIPQGYADFAHLEYGAADPKLDLFFYVADCRSGCTVEDMRNVIPSWKKAIIVAKAEVYKHCMADSGNATDAMVGIFDDLGDMIRRG
jgi:hypothetical protein